jgi:tetratricopeptide (TPR) repeat protein
MNKLQNFPTTYYMSLEESVDRQKNLTDQFKQYGITPIPVISKRFSKSDDKVTGKYLHQLNDGTKGCAISHLKAIKEWYDTTDEDYAFFCEDDLSLETIQYWNFTWEEFMDSLPEDTECVQLLTIRDEFKTFSIRERYWNDWAVTAYILGRDYAKRIIDTYIKDDIFHLEIPNSDVMPLIENIIFTSLGKCYTVPLFVENIEFDSTFSKDQDDDVNEGQKNNHKVANEIVLNYWKNKMKKYNVVDCFPYFNERELLELRINLLKDYVDLFVIIDGNYTHSSNPKPFTCKQVIEELNLPKDKIHLIELDMSDESVGPPTTDYDIRFSPNAKVGSRERFQRDAIKDILDKFDDDTVFIVSDCDEIINPNNIKFLSDLVRHNSKIFKIPLVFLEGRADLRVYTKDGDIELWDKSMFMCLKKHLEQTPATHIRNAQDVKISYATQNNQILTDLGWHFSWMQSPENRVYKFKSFCHAEDNLKILLNRDYTKDEHVEFMKSYVPKEGEISPCGNVNQILKKYPTENLPDIIWNLPRVKNYLLPEEYEIKTNLESLLVDYSLDTENPLNNFNLGVWYENEGHTAPALSYFLRCAERAEDNNLAYEALIRGSYCYDKQGTRDGSAKSLLEQALCLMPKRPEAYFLLSRFAERREWWQDCYIYADQGLMFADHESYPPLRTDVEYPGKYALLFEKAVSGYWWGKDKECKEIFLDLIQNYTLSAIYKNFVKENLKRIGVEIPKIDYDCEPIPVIGVPIVNGFHWLQRLVDSIDYPVKELCVINNNGKGELTEELDNLSKIDHEFIENIKVCHLPANIGCSGAWNLIIKTHMMDPYWLMASHDIAFSPGFLKEMVKIQSEHDNVGIVKGTEAQWDMFLLKDWVVQKCGLFDENFYPAYVEDCDYYIRTQKENVLIHNMNLHYLHGEKNYKETGSQTWRTDIDLKDKLTYVHDSNHYYMEEKWGSEWSGYIVDSNGVKHHHAIWNYQPHEHPYNNPSIPITYTSYDLKFVRRKNLGF